LQHRDNFIFNPIQTAAGCPAARMALVNLTDAKMKLPDGSQNMTSLFLVSISFPVYRNLQSSHHRTLHNLCGCENVIEHSKNQLFVSFFIGFKLMFVSLRLKFM